MFEDSEAPRGDTLGSPERSGAATSPRIYEGLLDDAELEALLQDIASLAEAIDVRVRGGDRRVSSGTAELRDIAARMRADDALAVQIRYRFDGVSWCDTLQRVATGVRILRVAAPGS